MKLPTGLFRSLRFKLLAASLLIEATMLAVLVGNSVRLIQEHVARQAEVRIQAIELAYKTAVAVPLAARDYATLRDILDGWKRAEEVSYLAVTDRKGQLLASVGWQTGQPFPAPTPVRDSGETIHVAFDVDFAGTTYGHVHYGISSRFLSDARNVLFQQSVTIALLELTLTFVLLLATGYWLTRGFADLAGASQRIAAGELDVRVPVRGDDEVAVVGHSFNAMAAAVRERMEAMRESEQRFRAIADYTYAWENWFGPDGALRWVNPAVERMTGYPVRDCMAMPNFPVPLVHAADRELVRRQHQQALAGRTGQDLEFRIDCRDGQTIWVAMAWQPIYDADGKSLGYRSSVRDITTQHFATEELAYAASHDALTGLNNRRAFEQELQRELDRSAVQDGPVIVFYIDLDQFKLVNDTCGHTAGDALLQHLARVMEARFSFGFLARLGGDEFGMVLAGMSMEEAERRAQHIIDDIRALPFVWEGKSFRVGASIGIAASSPQLNTVDDLLMAADTACYAAKERGRNRAQVYLPEDVYFRERQADFLSLTQISDALGSGRLALYGQRIHALRPDRESYYEVLVRMVGEGGEIIPPNRFIPAAERYGMMPLLDRWVFEASCRQLRAWQDAGIACPRLNINVSGLTLAEAGLTDFIRHIFREYGISPQHVGFEITESCAIAQLDQALEFIRFCGEIGCTLALDDFGSGLSSFGYLKRFRVQSLKIDGMFVKNADKDADDRAVIESMVHLARLRGLSTIAEFVTSPEVLETVCSLGVDYAQGFAIHVPSPLADVVSG
ncbi:Cyclic di-GMP phosphodiesterase PdeB [Rhodocyclaceae bacterium]|nr:Cyclic di-GMP phosphodiesterase PdeB [Rhodocyclaceae bacterium]